MLVFVWDSNALSAAPWPKSRIVRTEKIVECSKQCQWFCKYFVCLSIVDINIPIINIRFACNTFTQDMLLICLTTYTECSYLVTK